MDAERQSGRFRRAVRLHQCPGYRLRSGTLQHDLTRENFLKQALSFKGQRFKMMLPGVELNNSADDHAPYQSLRMARFEGSSWKLIDDGATAAQTSTTK